MSSETNDSPAPAGLAINCHGQRFHVVPGTNERFWQKVQSGQWEPGTFRVLDRHLRPGVTMLDIGSWVGALALYAAAKGARVICVEADPLALADLRANIAANPALAPRITVVSKAIHPSGEPVDFGSCGSGNDSRSSFALSGLATSWKVETIRPADLAAMVPPSEPLFIKMDIEGGEYSVVPAAGALWSRENAAALISLHPKLIHRNLLKRAIRMPALTKGLFRAFRGWRVHEVTKRHVIPRPDATLLGGMGLHGAMRKSSWLFTR